MALYQQQALSSYVVRNQSKPKQWFIIIVRKLTHSLTFQPTNSVGRLSITVAQAKLVRNYGLTRMDPYVRIRVGHFVFETQTDPNGGKTPHWNRVIHSQLPAGVNKISIEIYDECSFKMDELIAWAEIPIPEKVLRGETHEDWYPLSGKQGDGLEGSIDLVLSFSTQSIVYTPQLAPAPVVMVPSVSGPPLPVYVAAQQQQMQQQPPANPQVLQISEVDFKQVSFMSFCFVVHKIGSLSVCHTV